MRVVYKLSKQQEHKEKVKLALINNAEYLASKLVRNHDFELRSDKSGLVILELTKRRYHGENGEFDGL